MAYSSEIAISRRLRSRPFLFLIRVVIPDAHDADGGLRRGLDKNGRSCKLP